MPPTKRASTYVVSINTFGQDGRLDEGAFRHHLQRMAAAGIGFCSGGSALGEEYSMTPEEVRRTLTIAVKELKGKVPVRAFGVEPRTVRQMVEIVKMAEDCGVDAVQVFSMDIGHGFRPTNAEMLRYYTTVLEASAIPMVLSSHMAMGYLIPHDMVKRLADTYPHLVGVTYTTPETAALVNLVDLVGDRLEVHVGGPMHAMTALTVGANGFLSAEANIAPRMAMAIIKSWNSGDFWGAKEAYSRFIRVNAAPHGAGSVVCWTKAAMGAFGLPGISLRDPQLAPPENEVRAYVERLERLGIRQLEGL